MMTIRYLLLSILLTTATALAQPLSQFAPADTILSLGWHSQSNPIESLEEDFAALNWTNAGDTFEQLLNAAYDVTYDSDILELLDAINLIIEAQETPDIVLSEIYAICPATEGVVTAFRDYEGELDIEAILTVGLSAFSPMPAVTAIAHSNSAEVSAILADLNQALLGCASAMMGEDGLTQLDQDGTPLYVLSDGGDLPLVLASSEGNYIISTNPEAVRGVLRRIAGSQEASFADLSLAQTIAERLPTEGFSLSLDFMAAADALEAFSEMVPDDPALNVLVDRGLRFLSTLGGYAGTLYTTDEGIAFESLLAVNPDGGDELLAELLTCTSCTVSESDLIPQGSFSVASQYLPIHDIVRYIEDVIADLEEATGESIDFRAFLRENLDFDIDIALLDWLGNEVHTAGIESPLSLNLRDLFYGGDNISIIPVSSQLAARNGLEEIGRVFGDNLPLLLEIVDPFGDLEELAMVTESVAVRDYDYRGVNITRYQFSFNSELTMAFVDNNLVMGNSLNSISAVIDTALGEDSFLTDSGFNGFLGRSPDNVSARSFSYDQEALYALADILELGTQPAAYAISTAFQMGLGDYDDFYGYADLFEVEPEALSPGDISATLALPGSEENGEETSALNNDSGSDYYNLQGLSAGSRVTIELTSNDFDTYLYLIDADTEAYLDENDDAPDTTRSELSFIVEEGRSYWLQVTSFDGLGGDYSLTIASSEAEEGASNPEYFDRGFAYLGSALPQPLGPIEGYSSNLEAASFDTYDYVAVSDYYALEGLSPGDHVSISMSSDAFDGYLYLIDADFETYLAEEDGPYEGNTVELSFVAQEDVRYVLQVTSYFGDETGDYQLSYQVMDEMMATSASEPPSFTELIETAELIPEAIRVLADHLSTSETYTVVDGNIIYSSSLTRLRW